MLSDRLSEKKTLCHDVLNDQAFWHLLVWCGVSLLISKDPAVIQESRSNASLKFGVGCHTNLQTASRMSLREGPSPKFQLAFRMHSLRLPWDYVGYNLPRVAAVFLCWWNTAHDSDSNMYLEGVWNVNAQQDIRQNTIHNTYSQLLVCSDTDYKQTDVRGFYIKTNAEGNTNASIST